MHYFNVRADEALTRDEDGLDLADLDHVLTEARAGAKSLLKEAIDLDEIVDGQSFEITDDAGRLVLVYPFRDAIRLKD